jgi:hypothetical protein
MVQYECKEDVKQDDGTRVSGSACFTPHNDIDPHRHFSRTSNETCTVDVLGLVAFVLIAHGVNPVVDCCCLSNHSEGDRHAKGHLLPFVPRSEVRDKQRVHRMPFHPVHQKTTHAPEQEKEFDSRAYGNTSPTSIQIAPIGGMEDQHILLEPTKLVKNHGTVTWTRPRILLGHGPGAADHT